MHTGKGCPSCAGKISTPSTSIRAKRPDLIKYFKYPQDTDLYTVGSGKMVPIVCPDCGYERNDVRITELTRRGFYCKLCSDGISMPEKFGVRLLKQLNVDFITQYKFNWANNKFYDFWVDNKFIIETHGDQHYSEINWRKQGGQNLQKIIMNDKLKYDLAIANGIIPEHYIVIDCRYSTFEWLKENFTCQLKSHFDLNNVNWKDVWDNCQNSLMCEVWESWNNRENDATTTAIGNLFGLHKNTIIRYLKIGNNINKCEYNTKDEMSKIGYKISRACRKIVYQYSMDGEFIKQWDSISDAARKLNIPPSGISQCCNGKYKYASGFIWSFYTITNEGVKT